MRTHDSDTIWESEAPIQPGEIAKENQYLLQRQQTFRRAADVVAAKFHFDPASLKPSRAVVLFERKFVTMLPGVDQGAGHACGSR